MATNKTPSKTKATAKRSNPEPEAEVEVTVPVEPTAHVAEHDPEDPDSVAWRSAPHQTLPPSINNS
jgi:hypothetical protein